MHRYFIFVSSSFILVNLWPYKNNRFSGFFFWSVSLQRGRTGKPDMMQSMGSRGVEPRLSNWTTTTNNNPSPVHTQSVRFSQPSHMSSFPRITGLDEDLQFLRFTSGLLHVKACNTKHKIKNLNFKRSNLYYFIRINVIETRHWKIGTKTIIIYTYVSASKQSLYTYPNITRGESGHEWV